MLTITEPGFVASAVSRSGTGTPAGSTRPVRWAFSGHTPGLAPKEAWEDLRSRAAVLCAHVKPGHALNLASAEKASWSWLNRHARPQAVAGLRRAVRRGNAAVAHKLTVDAIVTRRPMAALDAALAWTDKDPQSAAAATSVASALVVVGQPRLAFPFAKRGAALAGKSAVVGGVHERALSLTQLAEVERLLGQTKAANRTADVAHALQPDLPEAASVITTLAACSGDRVRALRFFPLAVHPGRFDILDTKPTQNGRTVPVFTVTGGDTPPAWNVSTPTSVPLMAGVRDELSALQGATLSQEDRLLAEWQSLAARLPSGPKFRSPASVAWDKALFDAMYVSDQAPPMDSLFTDLSTAQQNMLDFWHSTFLIDWQSGTSPIEDQVAQAEASCAEGDEQCARAACQAAVNGPAGQWATLANQEIVAAEKAFGAQYRFVTGLARSTVDPRRRQAMLVWAQRADAVGLSFAEGEAILVAGGVLQQFSWCYGTADPIDEGDGTIDKPEDPDACPNQYAFRADLKIVELEIKCDSITVGAKSDGPVGVFGEVGWNWLSDKTTIYLGGRVGLEHGGVGAEAKGGIYIEGNSRGIEDVGIRTKESIGVGETLGGTMSAEQDVVTITVSDTASVVP